MRERMNTHFSSNIHISIFIRSRPRSMMYRPLESTRVEGHGAPSNMSNSFPTKRQAVENVHWQAPVVMLSALAAGFAFFLGHHFFYLSLHHVPTKDAAFEQQVNIAIGTAFAFIVRMFLAISVATVFWQLFWHNVRAKETTLSRIDTLSSVLKNVLEFRHVRAITQFPAPFAIAAIAWLIPLAAIIPPASLTVELSPYPQQENRVTSMSVPDFAMEKFAQMALDSGEGISTPFYKAPRFGVQQLVNTVATLGSLLDFPAPAVNSSYSLNFYAPALHCAEYDDTVRKAVFKQMSKEVKCDISAEQGTRNGQAEESSCDYNPIYLSWVPDYTHHVSSYNVTMSDMFGAGGTFDFKNTIGQYGELPGEEPASLAVGVQSYSQAMYTDQPWTVINCSLHNATYTVHVNVTGGAQDVEVVARTLTNPVGYLPNATVDSSTSEDSQFSTFHRDLTRLAYYSLLDALGRLLVGQMASWSDYDIVQQTVTQTSVMTTDLVDSVELSGLYRAMEFCSMGANASTCFDKEGGPNLTAPSTRPLSAAMEQLFENMTLSLFSDARYLTSPESEKSPKTNVTVLLPQNRYVYTRWRLIAPYTTAVALSLLACLVGLWAFYSNGASYSDRFSTILLMTRQAKLGGEFENERKNLVGADPLPPNLGVAKVWIGEKDAKLEMNGGEGGVELGTINRVAKVPLAAEYQVGRRSVSPLAGPGNR
ncbi:unnamed protein product [Periconia digitata]|uniref:Uncharacterized protein n=1 Tax=Periconia digitata TaxID=1303443 RepID=A0A9W4U5H1_9PLEO|nr:unnamed protein product [Periconia digitata]